LDVITPIESVKTLEKNGGWTVEGPSKALKVVNVDMWENPYTLAIKAKLSHATHLW